MDCSSFPPLCIHSRIPKHYHPHRHVTVNEFLSICQHFTVNVVTRRYRCRLKLSEKQQLPEAEAHTYPLIQPRNFSPDKRRPTSFLPRNPILPSAPPISGAICPGGNMSCCSRVVGYAARLEEGIGVVVGPRKVSGFVGGGLGRLFCARKARAFVVMSAGGPNKGSDFGVQVSEVGEDFVGSVKRDVKLLDGDDGGDVYHGNGRFSGGGGGGDGDGAGGAGGGNGGEGDGEEQELGRLMKLEEVIRESEARGVELPRDMSEAAKSIGLRKVLLERYLDLQGAVWPIGFAMRSCSMLRNRMLADPSFLFKVGAEIVIDSCCATIAEVQKRGKDFWSEFELYVADLLVGVVVNIALVGMLAPYARIGQPAMSKGLLGRMQNAYAALPSSVFEAERPGCKFSVNQRLATYFYKGILYGVVGFGCGIVGQGIANLIMTTKRNLRKSEEDIPVPPLFKSAALWGVFLAVSSNTRYQIINGLERLVEASPFAKKVPPAALAFTVGIRFANNIYGGMQFVDWARLSGVQ